MPIEKDNAITLRGVVKRFGSIAAVLLAERPAHVVFALVMRRLAVRFMERRLIL